VTVLAGGVGATVELEDPVAVVERENRPEGASAEDGPCGDETCASRDERLASMRVAFALPSPVKARRHPPAHDEATAAAGTRPGASPS
jgi:hypothetical protein